MPILAMRVTAVAEHPNADTLSVYTFEAPGRGPVQIVANQEHVYAVGDVAMVALTGTTLLDGLKIKRAKLRGIESLGMAMGPVDAEPGTDLSEGRCEPERGLGSGRVIKWSKIELLHNVKGEVLAQAELNGEAPPVLTYRAKVKLHGTNAGVQVRGDGTVIAQGRNQTLTPEADNMGFAAWVLDNEPAFAALATPEQHWTLFGEWCGPGVQRGVAINQVDRKVWVVFAAQLGDHHEEAARVVIEPDALAELVPEHPDVFVLPWFGEPIEVSFADPAAAAERLNAMVEKVERNDPWVKATFGVDGTGEGLVLYPMLDTDARDAIAPRLFKAKGEKHRVRKAKRAVEVDPEVVASVDAFVETFVTEARLEQGLAEACSDGISMKALGAFLKWVGQDVRSESADALAEAGLEWKQVGKAVTSRAKGWFVQKAR